MDSLPITRYSLHAPEKPPEANICVVGGTNVAHALATAPYVSAAFTLETPLGLSPTIYYGESAGVPFYHVTLHGSSSDECGIAEQDSLLRVWGTLHHLGVSDVLGGATAGSINPAYKLGDWVIADDFIDFNIDRKRSIAPDVLGPEAARILPRHVPADDPILRKILSEETARVAGQQNVHERGVIVQAAGGRFETAAEIRMFQQLGAGLVTMNVPTEMAYARQLNMNYSSLIVISNPAEGLGNWEWKTLSDLYPRLHAQSIKIYLAAVRRIHDLPERRRIGDTLRMHPDFDRSTRLQILRTSRPRARRRPRSDSAHYGRARTSAPGKHCGVLLHDWRRV
jgi:5'-methylthioadenosine phosphorylase